MDDFIVFSDMHFYKNVNKSKPDDEFLTSWVRMQFGILDQIVDYAKENGVKTIFHNGDLFEEKNRIPQDLYNLVWKKFCDLSDSFDFIFNTGNHEFTSVNRQGSLMPFDFVKVVRDVEIWHTSSKDYKIVMMPYGMGNEENLITFKSNTYKTILFVHENINEFMEYETINSIPASRFKEWNLVFNGHIHKPGEYKNIINIGSPYITDWNQADQQKRFIHYKNGQVIVVPIKHPQFIDIEGLTGRAKSKMEKDNFNFYRVVVDSSESTDDIFKKFNVSFKLVKSEKRKSRFSAIVSDEEEIERYLEDKEVDLNKKKLKDVGLELCDD